MKELEVIEWVRALAHQENSIYQLEQNSIDLVHLKSHVLSQETRRFFIELRFTMKQLILHFNSELKEGLATIKFLVDDETSLQFSLIRGLTRLHINSGHVGMVRLQMEKQLSQSETHTKSTVMSSSVVEGRFGYFNRVDWFLLEQPVNAQQVACHHFTEFIQLSSGARL